MDTSNIPNNTVVSIFSLLVFFLSVAGKYILFYSIWVLLLMLADTILINLCETILISNSYQ
jgi:hypothetical protein